MMSSHVALSDIFLITSRACFLVVGMKRLLSQTISECRGPLAGCQESGFSSGDEDQIGQFAHGPFAAFFRADIRRESVSLLCDFSAFGGLVKIIGGLQVHPELSGCSQRLGQIQSRISRHVPFAFDELIQTSSGPAEFLGKGRLRHARRLQKLFEKNLPWMKGVSGLFHGLTSILHDAVDLSKNVHGVAILSWIGCKENGDRLRQVPVPIFNRGSCRRTALTCSAPFAVVA